MTRGINSLVFRWQDLGVRVEAERYTDDLEAELSFYFRDGASSEVYLDTARVNLLSSSVKASMAKRLTKNVPDVNWELILSAITEKVRTVARQGEPVQDIGKKPQHRRIDYLLWPILEKNQPTTIYGPGGSGKSYIAAYIACLVQFDTMGTVGGHQSWTPTQGNVLYLDWEASAETHQRRVWAIKEGLDIPNEETFWYRKCDQPLANDIYNIQGLVSEFNIQLVIIDSQMAAAGYGPDASQITQRYYNALRSLACTTLTLDHVSKEEWSKNSGEQSMGPYGSVSKFNRSRSQFEVRKSQEAEDDFIEMAFVHRKHNEGKLLKPMGIRINFMENEEGELEKVICENSNLSDSPALFKVQSLKQQMIDLLKRGPMDVKSMSDDLEANESSVRVALNRNKDTFIKLSEGKMAKWGIVTRG